jgi:hypothetical protein
MNLAENESDWLARHLGHDIKVHREFYRLHESTVELAKVSKLLIASETGETHKFKGLSLDEIQDDQIHLEEDDSQSEDEDSADKFSDSSESSEISNESHRVQTYTTKKKKIVQKTEKDASKLSKILKRKYCQEAFDDEEPTASTSKALKKSKDPFRLEIFDFFQEDIMNKKVPNKGTIMKFIEQTGCDYTWLKVKEILNARIQREKRNSK